MNNDLISREALKKALHNFFDGKVIDEPAYILRDVFYHIDSAPAVEEKSYAMGYQDGLEDGLDGIRPQGEWIDTMYGFHTCSICGKYGNPNFFNFCPNCGADMRKGGAE